MHAFGAVISFPGKTGYSRGSSMNRMHVRTFRIYKLERVVDDLTNARKYGAKYIAFTDDKITLNIKQIESLL